MQEFWKTCGARLVFESNQRRCTHHAATFQALESAVFEAQGWLTEQLVKQIVVLRAVLQWNLLRSNAVHFAVQQLG